MTANPNAGLLDKVSMNETITATYTAVNGLIPKATYDLIATTTDNLGALLYTEGLTSKQKRAIAKAHKALSVLVVYPQADDDPFI